jgi:oxygen-dependent protoporphyrinogen oxidase
VAVAHVGTSEESLGVRPGGFGFLVVRGCAVRALGVLYSSSMFREHAPPGQVLLTMFYGGATDPGLIEIGDTALIEALRKDLAQTMRWDGRSQVLRITRHHAALPAYHLGHLERVRQIESAAAACPAPVRFVGNYLRGISIADCIRQAGMAADDLRERLTR